MRASINTVAFSTMQYFEVRPEEIFRKTRKREKVRVRQIFHYLSTKWTIKSLNEIGRYGERYGFSLDHATVIHSRKTIKDFISINDREIIEQITAVEDIIINEEYIKNKIIPHKIDLVKMCENYWNGITI